MITSQVDPPSKVGAAMFARTQTDVDYREHHRREVNLPLWLTDVLGETVLHCRCTNLSAGGIHAIAPVGYGLAVGQRYELRLSPSEDRNGSLLVGDSLGYATIIRTRLRANSDKSDVSFAARFDSPQYLPV